MTRIHRTALVEHSADQMFDLVNDIEQYPKFLPGCTAARVVSSSDTELVGELTLSKAGITQQFTTRNALDRPHSIAMEMVEGNFTSFDARWEFSALTDNACKVSLTMDFQVKSSLVGFAIEKLFSSVANAQVDAMVQRAAQVYGNSNV